MITKRLFQAATVILTVAACSDSNPIAPVTKAPVAPKLATAPVGPRWSIFTTQTPDALVDVTDNPGWEIATRFHSSKSGKVVGFRVWRASGETGTTSAKLWTDGGTKLISANLPTGTGWQTVYLATPYHISANTTYRVSANINTIQEKTFGTFQNGPITNGPLTADFSYYGQPAGAMPTQGSYSAFYVDVIFEEDVPLPNLYVTGINPTLVDAFGNPVVVFSVCNNGAAASAPTTTRYWHWVAPWSGGGYYQRQVDLSTPSIAAGSCYNFAYQDSSPIANNQYFIWADVNDVVYESNENDNFNQSAWARQF